MKDICLFLYVQSFDKESFQFKNSGYLDITVKPYTRELSEDEKAYIQYGKLPYNEVIIDSDGFSFEQIREVMAAIYQRWPAEYQNNFMYFVDFEKLEAY